MQGYDPMPRLGDALAVRWGNPASTRLVRWPLSLRVGRKPDALTPISEE
jgi:hypothetical protein